MFDIRFNDAVSSSQIEEDESQAINLEKNLHSLIKKNELVISAVTGKDALKVAEESSVNMAKGKIFVDMNTVAPQVKIQIGKIIEKNPKVA